MRFVACCLQAVAACVVVVLCLQLQPHGCDLTDAASFVSVYICVSVALCAKAPRAASFLRAKVSESRRSRRTTCTAALAASGGAASSADLASGSLTASEILRDRSARRTMSGRRF
ncbi:unnamed protein product [Amoebophrya sp. A120]|nr:unnamed protein product [Amoebophrya sp. A120]|eukprot:GSA120T00024431001.1